MIRGRDSPEAWRVWNLSHLWGRLRDFYQVRGREGEAEPGSPPGGRPISYRLPPPPQEELQLLILSPPPDLQTLGFDPFSGALSCHPSTPSCFYQLSLPVTPCGLCPAEEAVEELEGILRLLLGASVQVSGAGKGRVQLWAQGWRDAPWHQSHHPLLVPLQCEHRELFIRHIQGLSLEVQSELAAAIQEVR